MSSLPQAVKSPYSFIAYLGVILAWLIVALRVKRNRQLLNKIQHLPEGQRRNIILAEVGSPVPPELSPEQWLKSRRQSYFFSGFMGLLGVTVVVSAIAVTQLVATPYRLRVTVINAQEIPVEDAKVWSSLGGEPKKIAGGWQFDIPAANVPKDQKLIIYAAKKTAFLQGKYELQLGAERNPAITIQLQQDTSATVRGIVQDDSGQVIPGAMVSVIGYGEEAIRTLADGSFVLPAHAAIGQQVRLHAQQDGYAPADQYHPSGDEPAVIILDRK